MTTPRDVAEWMARQVEQGALYQDTVVWSIRREFGEQFVHEDANGNLAVARPVLRAFRKLTEQTIVWDRGDRAWRLREPHDQPGRQVE